MHSIVEVGSRLESGIDLPEGVTLTMVAGEPVQLTIALSRPHELEIQAVATAPTQFAWIDGEHVAVLAHRLGPVLPWSQAVYNPHLDALGQGSPDADASARIILVDRETNTVAAAHHVRWPDEFAATVRASVARMRERPLDRLAYDHVLAALHRRYPTPEDLVLDRADAHCTAEPIA